MPFHEVFRTGRRRWYCYDNLSSISKARSSQLNALVKQADLNIERDDLKALSIKQADLAEFAKSEVQTLIGKANALLKNPNANPADIKRLVQDVAGLDENTLPTLRVIEGLNRELAKRTELLTHVNFLYRAAGLLYWTDGEDPRDMVGPIQLEKKVELFKKKEYLLRILRSPISVMFYRVDPSSEDSVILLKTSLLNQEPFLKFGDEILKQIKTRFSPSTSPSASTSETNFSISSPPSEKTNPNTKSGSVDPKKLFSDILNDSES
jgi:hypothetical protein